MKTERLKEKKNENEKKRCSNKMKPHHKFEKYQKCRS